MKRWTISLLTAVGLVTVVASLAAPATAQLPASAPAAPYCGITWGSTPETVTSPAADPLIGVRAGRHDCYDRLVLDIDGGAPGYTVSYVPAVTGQASGAVVPLRGGAFLQIDARVPAYDDSGPTYAPANPAELVNLAGYRTFRQAAWGGSFEGQTTVGLGVRARLPFRVLVFKSETGGSRMIIDVAHRW